jgi:hypothetical protein
MRSCPVPTHPIAEELDRLAERFDLHDFELAALAGVSPNTVRFARATGAPPKQADTLRAVVRLIERAKTAHRRSDLSLAPHPLRRGSK